uniref:Hyaluronidase n=1 Tax=Neogobius melanostomus TaxID=47308 RepID=A0A8C6S9H9_9GOBI
FHIAPLYLVLFKTLELMFSGVHLTFHPLFEEQPFIVTWNIPDLVCKRHNILLDTSPFRGVATPAKVPGQFLSLFYTDRLGLYPHVDVNKGQQHNGGIPQSGDLKASMKKAQADISYYIPSKKTKGLAVIDWESWRPVWERNWGTKRIYQTLSLAHVLKTNRYLTQRQATEKAKHQFQVAAKSWMSGMLAMGKAMRPNYLWGFYLFPNCYNYNWNDSQFTGTCSEEVRRQNDQLQWLWDSSTALFPSVYLQSSLADSPKAALMVRGRVREALRVSAPSRNGPAAPVFAYTRPVYVDQSRRFLSQVNEFDNSYRKYTCWLLSLWGNTSQCLKIASCRALSAYLKSTLNPYITNVTTAAQMCSLLLCRGNGRCVRKDYNSQLYLHLNPDSFRILRLQKGYIALGKPSLSDLKALSRGFTCQCYEGLNCTPRNLLKNNCTKNNCCDG